MVPCISMLSPNLLKSQISYTVGGCGSRLTFQLLILSPNLLKFKIPFVSMFVENDLIFNKRCAIPSCLFSTTNVSFVHYVYV